ncbi:MAG: ABC transporter permease [Clostridia bacterium]|nr:ABC transporter permease [Clostridia bacterium]
MLKRDLKFFFHSLARASLLLVLLASICIGAAAAMTGGASSKGDIIKVAIVDNEDSVISRILINTISEMDYIRSMISVEQTDEESAMEAVKSGECTAAIILPENFISDIARGRESQGNVYLSKTVSSQGELIESAVNFGEKLIVSGQFGVFAGEHVIDEHDAGDEVHDDYLLKSNTAFLAEIMADPQRYFTVEELSYENSGLDTVQYFVVCWLCAMLFLISLFFIQFFMRDCTRPLLSRLASYKLGAARFMLWKLVIMTLFRYIIILAVILPLSEPLSITVNLITPLAAAYFITLSSACLTMCTGDGITSNTLVTLGGLLLCGGLIPTRLLPIGVRYIGQMSPFGAAKAIIEPMFGASPDPVGLCFALVYAALSAILIKSRITNIISGKCDA